MLIWVFATRVRTEALSPGGTGIPSLTFWSRGIGLVLGDQVLPSNTSEVTIRSGAGSSTLVR